MYSLDHESLDLVLQGLDLVHQVTGLVGGDAAGDNGTADTACSAQSTLGGDVAEGWSVHCDILGSRLHSHVWYVLVLGEKRQVEENGQGSSVCGEDDNLRDTAVQCLCGCI